MASNRVVDAYYADVTGVTLLNAELERRLFHEYRTCAGCSRTYTEGATVRACPDCKHARNLRSRDELVNGALRFVVKVAREYARRAKGERHGEELLLALISAGNLGLLVAVDRFELTRGTRFLTYAAWWVREKILEELDNMGVVRVPAYQQKAQRARWKQAGNGELEAPYVTLEPLTELDRVKGDEDLERNLLNRYGSATITKILQEANVSTRDQYILMLHLGSREDPKNLKQIAARVGCTPEQVRAVKKDTLALLRDALGDSDVTDFSDVFV